MIRLPTADHRILPLCIKGDVFARHIAEYERVRFESRAAVGAFVPTDKALSALCRRSRYGDLIARFGFDLCNGASAVRNESNRIGFDGRYHRPFITAYITGCIGVVIVNVRRKSFLLVAVFARAGMPMSRFVVRPLLGKPVFVFAFARRKNGRSQNKHKYAAQNRLN